MSTRPSEPSHRVDAFDVGVLVAFASLSVWLVAVALSSQNAQHIWTGTDGPYLGDQMQYLGWIRDSADHVLIGNPYQLRAGPHDFLHPGLAISGGLNRLGLSASLAYLVWKPVAVLALFGAARAYVRRLLAGTAQRRFALVLALFFLSPVAYLAGQISWHWHGAFFLQPDVFEMWPGLYLWGYPFTAIAVALIPATLLAYERARTRDRVGVIAPALGMLCAWLQPWQGSTVIVILLAAELVMWRRQRVRFRIVGVTVGATTVPLIYYSILSRADSSWRLASVVNRVGPWPWRPLVVAVAPLALLALLAYFRPIGSFQAVAVRIWPLAALAIYGFIAWSGVGTFPLHALQGLSIPLAVLAVDGVSRVRSLVPERARVATAIVALLVLAGPAFAKELGDARDGIRARGPYGVPYFVTPGERDAMSYIERSPVPGGVFATVYLGQVIPARTGRRTWIGVRSWTPDIDRRQADANAVFSKQTAPSVVRRVVRSSGAHFVLSDCRTPTDLTVALRPILQETHHFGCATVYVIR